MLLSMYYLQDGVERLKVLEKTSSTQTTLQRYKARAIEIVNNIILACEEIKFTMEDFKYISIKDNVLEMYGIILKSEDFDQINSLIKNIISIFENTKFQDFSTYNFKEQNRRNTLRFVPLSTSVISEISKVVPVISREIQFLDARCNTGDNLHNLTKDFSSKITYGVEADNPTAIKAREKINRVAMGQFQGSRISNDVFDVMFCEPTLTWNVADNLDYTPYTFKDEKLFLNNTIKYLRPNGIGIIILPYYKLYKDICVFIAKNYKDVQVRKPGRDFYDKSGCIVITGIKKIDTEIDEETYKTLKVCHDEKNIKDLFAYPLTPYSLPNNKLNVDIFRGSLLDTEELTAIINTSGAFNSFWKNQRTEKLSESSKRPLLPFNIGQIGLVLTSGCLDGIIDEGNGNYHMIKGKVSKQSSIESNFTSDNEIETEETISNRVEINLLLANGEYKVLA